jgi:hypothetical protein
MVKHAAVIRQAQPEPVQPTILTHEAGWAVMLEGERITLRLPLQVSAHIAIAATEALVLALACGRRRLVVVLDLLDVDEFDASAPVAAIHVASRVRFVVERVELLVRDQAVRAAAIAALRVLEVPFMIAESRDRA